MPSQLDIHLASTEEIAATHRNVHDIWSKGVALDPFVASRLRSPFYRRATWCVGCVEGRVVTSLGSYPTEFQVSGNQIPGYAIASVYTIPEYRGRGYAPRLIEWVEQYERANGAQLALLYSDVKPDYYAAMGYVLCPARAGWRNLREFGTPAEGATLVEFDGPSQLSAMSAMYHIYHGAAPISIGRSDDYWRVMFQRFPNDRYFWMTDENGTPLPTNVQNLRATPESHVRSEKKSVAAATNQLRRAYARLTPDPHGYRIFDYACADQNPRTLADLYRSLLTTASTWGIGRLGGWLPDVAISRKLFEVNDRTTEITMVKPLSPNLTIDDKLIAATGRFCELDHV